MGLNEVVFIFGLTGFLILCSWKLDVIMVGRNERRKHKYWTEKYKKERERRVEIRTNGVKEMIKDYKKGKDNLIEFITRNYNDHEGITFQIYDDAHWELRTICRDKIKNCNENDQNEKIKYEKLLEYCLGQQERERIRHKTVQEGLSRIIHKGNGHLIRKF